MRELSLEELKGVRGGSCADFEAWGWAMFGGAIGGFMRGAAGGPLVSAANGIFGGAMAGAMYLISHDAPCS